MVEEVYHDKAYYDKLLYMEVSPCFMDDKNNFKSQKNYIKKDTFSCIVLRGRRRVGKTTLIQQCMQDKKAIFYSAIEMKKELTLEKISRAILQNNHMIFAHFEQAL